MTSAHDAPESRAHHADTELRHAPDKRTAEVRQHPGRPDHHRSIGERQWLQILYQARFGSNIVCRASRLLLLLERGHDGDHARDPVPGDPC